MNSKLNVLSFNYNVEQESAAENESKNEKESLQKTQFNSFGSYHRCSFTINSDEENVIELNADEL